MSHVATVDCHVTNLTDARAAGMACGLHLMDGQTTYTSYAGQQLACAHALRLQDHRDGVDHEIGLLARESGEGWDLSYDPWNTEVGGYSGGRLEAAAGVKLAKFKQQLATAASMRVLRRQGYRVTSTVQADGHIRLSAQR